MLIGDWHKWAILSAPVCDAGLAKIELTKSFPGTLQPFSRDKDDGWHCQRKVYYLVCVPN